MKERISIGPYQNEITPETIIELVPSLSQYHKGNCFMIPRENETYFVQKNSTVFLVKKKCLNCLHFKIGKGCGIGPDCKSICLIPEEHVKGWTNIKRDGKILTSSILLFIAKIFILSERNLEKFIQEQIPENFHHQSCKKFVRIKPLVYRILMDLDQQEEALEKKYDADVLPNEERWEVLVEIKKEQ
jgi:hypothetical protein